MSVWSCFCADYLKENNAIIRPVSNLEETLNKRCLKSSCLVHTQPDYLSFCPANWWADFSAAISLLKKSDRDLSSYSAFFIHSHELLIAVHRGHRAKRLRPTPQRGEYNKDKRCKERGLRLGLVVWRFSLSCQHCKHHKLTTIGLSIKPNYYSAFPSLKVCLILWAHFVPECVITFCPHRQECFLFFIFLPSRLFFSCLFWESCKCGGSPVQIGEQNNQSSTVRCNSHVWDMNTGTATHNAPTICSFISLEHPFLVQVLKFINIHTTFICGNVAHGVGILVSEIG